MSNPKGLTLFPGILTLDEAVMKIMCGSCDRSGDDFPLYRCSECIRRTLEAFRQYERKDEENQKLQSLLLAWMLNVISEQIGEE